MTVFPHKLSANRTSVSYLVPRHLFLCMNSSFGRIQGGIFSGWLSKLAGFFGDAWALTTSSHEEGPSVGTRRVSDREKTAKWAPSKRFIHVQGRKKMLMAILWCTEEELLLAKKYPEVWGHDTKACTDDTGVPWWYTVGFREDLRTFIGMRGHIA